MFSTCFLYLIWIIRRAVFPLSAQIPSLQSFHPALVIKTYPTNLQGSFLMFIVRSHIRFCLYIFVFTLSTTLFNQFTQPNISFLLSTIIFINQTCLFASISFQPVLSTLSFFFFNHLPQHLNSQFSQTILYFRNHFLSQQPFQPISFSCSTMSLGFLAFTTPPPAIFLARLSISFVFTEKSWGEPCRGIELSIPRICVAHV